MPAERRRFLEAQAARTGTLPATLRAAPRLDPDLAVFWDAFCDLACGHGAIAIREIAAWCALNGVACDDRRRMPRLLRAMETVLAERRGRSRDG